MCTSSIFCMLWMGTTRHRPAMSLSFPPSYPVMPKVTRPAEELVLVQFKGHRKCYYHNRRRVALSVGQYCLVEADRGQDMGQVKYVGPGQPEWWHQADHQGVLLAASERDLKRLYENRGDEWEFWDICNEKILYRRLDMSLVSVERQFDHKKITFLLVLFLPIPYYSFLFHPIS